MSEPDEVILISGVTLGIMAYIVRRLADRCCDAIPSRRTKNQKERALELSKAMKTVQSIIGHRALTEDEVKALEYVLSEAEYRVPHRPVVRNGMESCPDCKCTVNFKNMKYYCPKCGKYYQPYG